MTDVFSRDKRSQIMGQVHGKDTKPEIVVRSIIHRMGYRFRLHDAKLPGKPDIVLPKYRKLIFVHGCFWHQHPGCPNASRPASNTEYWNRKLDRNIQRDHQHEVALQELGWGVLVVWECELRDSTGLSARLREFLTS